MFKKPIPSLTAVREGILQVENPRRILDDKEPLYSFYQKETDSTINIITGEIKNGKWAADLNNATLLVPFKSPNALIQ